MRAARVLLLNLLANGARGLAVGFVNDAALRSAGCDCHKSTKPQ